MEEPWPFFKNQGIESIGLKVGRIDNNPNLSELVYRIQIVCSLLFDMTTAFKIFATEHCKMFRHAAPPSVLKPSVPFNQGQKQEVEVVTFDQKCPKCKKVHRIYGKLKKDPKIDEDCKKQGLQPFPSDSKLNCSCGCVIDISAVRNEIEIKTGKKLIIN